MTSKHQPSLIFTLQTGQKILHIHIILDLDIRVKKYMHGPQKYVQKYHKVLNKHEKHNN